MKDREDGKMETVNADNSLSKFHCKREGERYSGSWRGQGINKRLWVFAFEHERGQSTATEKYPGERKRGFRCRRKKVNGLRSI